MRWFVIILLSVAVAPAQSPAGSGGSRYAEQTKAMPPVAKVLVPTLSEVKLKSGVIVLLPSELPQPIANAKYASVDSASEDEYAISLYFDLGGGGSSFAAYFAANAHPKYGPSDIGGVREVKLVLGLAGYFRPVSCGGSCAPANLWWEEDHTLYQIQLELPSVLPEGEQQEEITAAANSAILSGPR
jgi:hypothetical protein